MTPKFSARIPQIMKLLFTEMGKQREERFFGRWREKQDMMRDSVLDM